MSKTADKYSPEVHESGVCLVLDNHEKHLPDDFIGTPSSCLSRLPFVTNLGA